jgi:hypothetical protein
VLQAVAEGKLDYAIVGRIFEPSSDMVDKLNSKLDWSWNKKLIELTKEMADVKFA